MQARISIGALLQTCFPAFFGALRATVQMISSCDFNLTRNLLMMATAGYFCLCVRPSTLVLVNSEWSSSRFPAVLGGIALQGSPMLPTGNCRFLEDLGSDGGVACTALHAIPSFDPYLYCARLDHQIHQISNIEDSFAD